MHVCILHSLLPKWWSTVLFQVVSTVPRRKSCPQAAQHNISNHNRPDIASASPVADQLCRTHCTVSYTLQLFVCPIHDLGLIKVSFSGDYTATRPYSTSVDLSAPNSVYKHSYAAVRMFADVIRDDMWSIRAYLPFNILKHAYVCRLWHIKFGHSSLKGTRKDRITNTMQQSSLKETRKARITNTMQHIRGEVSPRFKSCLQTSCTTCDFGLLPRSRRELPLSGLLCSEWWWFLTDILGQPIGPIFKCQESSNKQISSTVNENNRNTSIIIIWG